MCVSQIGDWVAEKMLMARDTSHDEAQKLHKKWLKHQTFMAELAQNKEWLDKIEKVSSYLWGYVDYTHYLQMPLNIPILYAAPFVLQTFNCTSIRTQLAEKSQAALLL